VNEPFDQTISQFEELLQKITTNLTSGIIFEKLPPSEVWKKSESDVTALRSSAEQLRDLMLLLKPERASSVKKRAEALLLNLGGFREALFRKSDDPFSNSKLALEELRRAVLEGSNLLDLARQIKTNPSEVISTILRLREVYEAKEYLSAIPVPEVTYTRFAGLRKTIENLNMSVTSAERALSELKQNLALVIEELGKFRSLPSEKAEAPSKDLGGSEPSLVSEDKQ